MSSTEDCKITDYKESKDYVKVTFSPDLKRFQSSCFDDDLISLLTKRVYDIAGCCGVKVWLNGRRLPINDFKSYVDLYFKQESQEGYVQECFPSIACFNNLDSPSRQLKFMRRAGGGRSCSPCLVSELQR